MEELKRMLMKNILMMILKSKIVVIEDLNNILLKKDGHPKIIAQTLLKASLSHILLSFLKVNKVSL